MKKAARRLKRRKQRHEEYVKEQREIGLGELEQKMHEEGLLQGWSMRRDPPGTAKMSVVLGQFADPYAGTTETQQQYENMLGLAVLAWNIALQPEEERQPTIENILQRLDRDPEYQAFARGFLEEMIARKLKHFAGYTRRIIELHVRDLGDRYHLSVASSLE